MIELTVICVFQKNTLYLSKSKNQIMNMKQIIKKQKKHFLQILTIVGLFVGCSSVHSTAVDDNNNLSLEEKVTLIEEAVSNYMGSIQGSNKCFRLYLDAKNKEKVQGRPSLEGQDGYKKLIGYILHKSCEVDKNDAQEQPQEQEDEQEETSVSKFYKYLRNVLKKADDSNYIEIENLFTKNFVACLEIEEAKEKVVSIINLCENIKSTYSLEDEVAYESDNGDIYDSSDDLAAQAEANVTLLSRSKGTDNQEPEQVNGSDPDDNNNNAADDLVQQFPQFPQAPVAGAAAGAAAEDSSDEVELDVVADPTERQSRLEILEQLLFKIEPLESINENGRAPLERFNEDGRERSKAAAKRRLKRSAVVERVAKKIERRRAVERRRAKKRRAKKRRAKKRRAKNATPAAKKMVNVIGIAVLIGLFYQGYNYLPGGRSIDNSNDQKKEKVGKNAPTQEPLASPTLSPTDLAQIQTGSGIATQFHDLFWRSFEFLGNIIWPAENKLNSRTQEVKTAKELNKLASTYVTYIYNSSTIYKNYVISSADSVYDGIYRILGGRSINATNGTENVTNSYYTTIKDYANNGFIYAQDTLKNYVYGRLSSPAPPTGAPTVFPSPKLTAPATINPTVDASINVSNTTNGTASDLDPTVAPGANGKTPTQEEETGYNFWENIRFPARFKLKQNATNGTEKATNSFYTTFENLLSYVGWSSDDTAKDQKQPVDQDASINVSNTTNGTASDPKECPITTTCVTWSLDPKIHACYESVAPVSAPVSEPSFVPTASPTAAPTANGKTLTQPLTQEEETEPETENAGNCTINCQGSETEGNNDSNDNSNGGTGSDPTVDASINVSNTTNGTASDPATASPTVNPTLDNPSDPTVDPTVVDASNTNNGTGSEPELEDAPINTNNGTGSEPELEDAPINTTNGTGSDTPSDQDKSEKGQKQPVAPAKVEAPASDLDPTQEKETEPETENAGNKDSTQEPSGHDTPSDTPSDQDKSEKGQKQPVVPASDLDTQLAPTDPKASSIAKSFDAIWVPEDICTYDESASDTAIVDFNSTTGYISAQQGLGVAAVAVLVLVGYCLAKPVRGYFKAKAAESKKQKEQLKLSLQAGDGAAAVVKLQAGGAESKKQKEQLKLSQQAAVAVDGAAAAEPVVVDPKASPTAGAGTAADPTMDDDEQLSQESNENNQAVAGVVKQQAAAPTTMDDVEDQEDLNSSDEEEQTAEVVKQQAAGSGARDGAASEQPQGSDEEEQTAEVGQESSGSSNNRSLCITLVCFSVVFIIYYHLSSLLLEIESYLESDYHDEISNK